MPHWKIWQLLLCLAHFVNCLFFCWIYCRYLALLFELRRAAGSKSHHFRTPNFVWVLAVLGKWVSEIVCCPNWLLRHCILLLEYRLLFFNLLEPGMLKRLRSSNSVIRIIHQQFHNQILHIGRRVWN
jgi:hypothetical protein